jgi:amino acid transporter
MFLSAGAGATIGLVFGAIVAALLDRPHLNPAPAALFIGIATPIGTFIGAMFGAVSVLQEEIRKLQREMQRWQRIEDLIAEIRDQPSSTQFKSGPP